MSERDSATTERRPRPTEDAARDAVTTAPAHASIVVRGALAFARDRYEAGRLLGEGGMGEVVSARDRDLGREVAMKLVRPGRDSETNVVRFLREARVQAQLEHPSIVPVYDVGRDLGDRPFFTMRRVQGVTLDAIIDRLRMGTDPAAQHEYPRTRLLELFTEVCLAVEFSHSRGILHRDLKPSNVMLGDFGEVYVLDWGVAKIATTSSASIDVESAATAVGTAVGTPAYMAPEQALGLPVDQRADVFTLGALLFELLALEPFVNDANVEARMRDPTLEIAPRPSQRAPSRKIPPELDAICETALATNPSLRYMSARALYEAVEAYLSADREQHHRHELAESLLERARSATKRVLAGKEEERSDALAAIGRAIAMRPEDEEPLRLLRELLAQPPARIPPDLEGRVVHESLTRLRGTLPRLAIAYGAPWVTIYPIVAAIAGVRHWDAVLPVVAWLIASVTIYVDYQRRKKMAEAPGEPIPPTTWLPSITLLGAIAITTVVAGPFFLVPPFSLATAKGLVLSGFRIRTRWIVITGMLAVLVPTALAWSGIHPIYGWRDGSLVLDGAIGLSPQLFCLVVTFAHLAILLGASLFASSYRDTLDQVEMKNLLLTWRLSQLVGTEVDRQAEEQR